LLPVLLGSTCGLLGGLIRRLRGLLARILRCAEYGRPLVATTILKDAKNYRRLVFYYQCATRR
jgi:hypothetical protein